MALAWFVWGSIAWAACEGPVSRDEFNDLLRDAEAAYVALDEEGFEEATTLVRDALPCLGEPLSTLEAAGVHRVEAVAAFFERRTSAAELSFVSVRAVQPGWRLPDAWAPGAGHPLRQAWTNSATLYRDDTTPFPPPRDGWVVIDGARAEGSPVARPFVAQWIDDDGVSQATALVDPTRTAGLGFDYPARKHAESSPPPPRRGPRDVPGKVALAAGLATAATGAGWYLETWRIGSHYAQDMTDAQYEVYYRDHLRPNVQVATVLLAGGGALAIGSGVGLAVSPTQVQVTWRFR